MMLFTDFLDIQLLASIAKFGSVRAAAEAHCISQPAASRRLNILEHRASVTLFRRGPHGTQLTGAGEFWAEEAIALLEHVDKASQQFALRFGDTPPPLRVGASRVVADYLLPTWLDGWRHEGARGFCSVEVGNSRSVLEKVREGSVELGVCALYDGAPSNLVCIPLVRDRLVLVASPSHPLLSCGDTVTPEDLSRIPLIWREDSSGTQALTVSFLRRFGVDLCPAAMQVDSITAVKGAVEGGMAPAILSQLTVMDEVATGQLSELQIEEVDLTFWIAAVHQRGVTLNALGSSLLDHMRSYVA